MTTKFFNLHSHRWNEIGKSKLGENYLLVKRPIPARSRMGVIGQCVLAMDVLKKEIPVHLLARFEKANN